MASNIPLGTFMEDGVRTGPLYSGQVPSSLLPFNPTLDLSYSSNSAYGPGILLSAQNTWNITPATTGNANIVARTNAIADFNNLTLTGDNVATKLISQSNTPTHTQFDWPRVPAVTISGATLGNALRITIFGYDWIGNPMQHTYVVREIGTYPTVINGTLNAPVVGGGFIPINAKSFYSVSRVSSTGQLANGSLSIGASDIFGLPFLVNNAGDITSIGWGNNSDLQNNAGLLSAPSVGTSPALAGNPGTMVIPLSSVTASSKIFISRNTAAGAQGNLRADSNDIIPNTSFTIRSTGNEQSTINWEVINPSGQYTASGFESPDMVAGVVTIFTSQVQANSNIQLTLKTFGTAHGRWYVSAIVPGVSFTVTSTDNTETSTVTWAIMPQNWAQGTSSNLVATGGGSIVFVNAPSVQANSNILLTYKTNPGANSGVLSAPISTTVPPAAPNNIIPGVGFTIKSQNALDVNQVNWVITNLVSGTNGTQGTNTLVAGTILVPTTSAAANSIILLSDNTLNAPTSYVSVTAINPGVSFTITAQANTDLSSINWAIFPANFFLSSYVAPLGTFVAADQTFPPTSTTGDVRGLYGPSSTSNGVNVLRFTSYVQGADQWINQVANNQFVETSSNQPVVGVQIAPLTTQDLDGYPQFYTGNSS